MFTEGTSDKYAGIVYKAGTYDVIIRPLLSSPADAHVQLFIAHFFIYNNVIVTWTWSFERKYMREEETQAYLIRSVTSSCNKSLNFATISVAVAVTSRRHAYIAC